MEEYNMTWKTFGKHLSQTVQDMLVDDTYANVTLVCDDQKQLRAHKFILSACSPVFRSVLRNNSAETNPLIILRGISSRDMEDILKFMYQGETSVTKDRIKNFMKAAEELEVKIISKKQRAKKDKAQEIVEIDMEDHQDESKTDEGQVIINADHPKLETESLLSKENSSMENIETLEDNVKTAMSVEDLVELAFGSNALANNSQISSFYSSDFRNDIEIDSSHEVTIKDESFDSKVNRSVKKEKLVSVENGKENPASVLKCTFCKYEAKLKSTLRKHVRTSHEFSCTKCAYVGNRNCDLSSHMRKAHPGLDDSDEKMSFSCNDCSYVGSKKCNLMSHIRQVHTSSDFRKNRKQQIRPKIETMQ